MSAADDAMQHLLSAGRRKRLELHANMALARVEELRMIHVPEWALQPIIDWAKAQLDG